MARILIIDDDPDIRTILTDTLSEIEGEHTVVQAEDGLKGLQEARANTPDLVIVDVNMPVLNGYEVCKRLRADAPTRGIPILMLTGANDLAGAIKGLGHGADDHITKPFHVEEVAARVRALLMRGR